LIVSEEAPLSYVKASCSNCGWTMEDLVRDEDLEQFKETYSKCPICGQSTAVDRGDVIEHLMEVAKNFNTKVEIVSTATEEGKGFLDSFKGMAALLRYMPQ